MGEKQYIVDFLNELENSPEKRKEFETNGDAMMDAAGFTAEDKEVVNSGDADRIREHLGDDAPDQGQSFWA